MKIQDRYASAIRASSLKHDPRSHSSNTDVLGAYGLASRYEPLAVALERLLAGDNKQGHEVVRLLAQLAWSKSSSLRVKPKLTRIAAHDIACACLAWYRNGTCKPCGGLGQTLIPGTTALSGHVCQVCRGTGKVPFEQQIKPEWRELACWLQAEMQRSLATAGPAAMRKLAPSFDL